MNLKNPWVITAAAAFMTAAVVTGGGIASATDGDGQAAADLPEPTVLQAGESVDADTSVSYRDDQDTQVITHPGATYIKVHFSSLDLAPGDYITVTGPDSGETYTYHGAPDDGRIASDSGYTVHSDTGFAAMSVFGDTAEVTLHRGSDTAANADGVTIDRFWRGFDAEEFVAANADTRSVCDNDARLDVVCYAESHPDEYDKSKAVARLLMDGSGLCTAWRVGNTNRMLTNNHCVEDQAGIAATESQFGYECATCGGDDPAEGTKVGGETMVGTDAGLDYTLYSVQNFDSIADYGTLYVEEREPTADERIYIPGHGDATPKRLSIFEEEEGGTTCKIDTVELDSVNAGYYCDTSGGNSGSPVVAGDTHKVIALHHLGGCQNAGTRMSLIYPEIAGEIDNAQI